MRLFNLILIFFIGYAAQAQRTGYKLDVITQYSKAQNELSAGRVDEAYTLFQSCLAKDSACAEAYLSLSMIDFDRGDLTKSYSNAKKGQSLTPFDAQANRQLGKVLYAQGFYEEASIFLKKAIALDNSNASGYYYLALTHQSLNDNESSVFYFEKAITLMPDNEQFWNSRGLLFMQMEQYEDAKNDFAFALKLAPTKVPYRVNLANALFKINENQQALQVINKGKQTATPAEKADLYALEGYYYLDQQLPSKADSCFKMAIQLDAEETAGFIGQAAVDIAQEDFASALENCNTALALNPNLIAGYVNRGIANEMLRNTAKACLDWEQAFVLGSQTVIDYLNSPVCNE